MNHITLICSLVLTNALSAMSIPLETLVFNEYQEEFVVDSLKDHDVLSIVDCRNQIQDAEVFNVRKTSSHIVFDVFDYPNAVIVIKLKKNDHKPHYSKFRVSRNFFIATLGFAMFSSVSGGPVCASLCPGLCPLILAGGCHPIVQGTLLAAVSTLTGGLGTFAAGSVVTIICNPITLGEMTATCVPTCTVALAVPCIP